MRDVREESYYRRPRVPGEVCRYCGEYAGLSNQDRVVNGWVYCSRDCYYEDIEHEAAEDEWRFGDE